MEKKTSMKKQINNWLNRKGRWTFLSAVVIVVFSIIFERDLIIYAIALAIGLVIMFVNDAVLASTLEEMAEAIEGPTEDDEEDNEKVLV